MAYVAKHSFRNSAGDTTILQLGYDDSDNTPVFLDDDGALLYKPTAHGSRHRPGGSDAPPFFVSAEQTGTGSSQNIAHGLGYTPTKVWVVPTELPADLTAGYDSAQGTHDATNCVVTVTNGCKYVVIAW